MNQTHRRVGLLAVLLLLLSPSLAVVAQQADNEYQTGAVLWMQTSGERAALSYQAFSLARMMLDRDLRTRSRMKRAGLAGNPIRLSAARESRRTPSTAGPAIPPVHASCQFRPSIDVATASERG